MYLIVLKEWHLIGLLIADFKLIKCDENTVEIDSDSDSDGKI